MKKLLIAATLAYASIQPLHAGSPGVAMPAVSAIQRNLEEQEKIKQEYLSQIENYCAQDAIGCVDFALQAQKEKSADISDIVAIAQNRVAELPDTQKQQLEQKLTPAVTYVQRAASKEKMIGYIVCGFMTALLFGFAGSMVYDGIKKKDPHYKEIKNLSSM